MNTWKIFGFIFLGFGLMVMIGGLAYAATVGSVTQAATDIANSYGAVVPSGTSTVVFIFAFAPFLIGSVVCFVIAALGLILGSRPSRQPIPAPSPQ